MNHTTTDLEHQLRDSEPDRLTAIQLAGIRARGRRRRRTRLTACAGGAAAAVIAFSLIGTGVGGSGGGTAEDRVPAAAAPESLSAVAQRALADIPGTVQVSDWQVVVPFEGSDGYDSQVVPAEYVDGGPVDIGAHRYSDIANFGTNARGYPAWLLGEANRDQGVYVDTGEIDLACTRPLPGWGGDDSDGCAPAMLQTDGDKLTYAWGMGTDEFLQPGSDLELFSIDDFSDATARTVWVGGRNGTDANRIELITTDGTVTEATVAADDLVPDDTMFWGTVSGDLAEAVVYDADGTVLERHVVRPCDDPVDCEVR